MNVRIPRMAEGPLPYESRPESNGPGWWLWAGIVMVRCPQGHDCWLPHAVDERGMVTPSVVCPVPGCGWHEMVELEMWDGIPKTRDEPGRALDQRKAELGL